MEVMLKENYLANKLNKNNNKKIYINILNILACISVVIIHMNNIVHMYNSTEEWKSALFIVILCSWAVPVFIMISGATLFKYRDRYDTKEFFKRRIGKVIIPWIFWSLVMFVINNKNINLLQFIKDFLYCKIGDIFWFFPLILYLYFLIPIFSVFNEKEEYKNILKGIVIYLFILSIMDTMFLMLGMTIPEIFSYFFRNSIYIIYLVLGYLLSTENISKRNKIIIYILGLVSVLVLYISISIRSAFYGYLDMDLFKYTTPFVIIIATAVFLLIKSINWEKIVNKLSIKTEYISKIAACSFGIYLIQMLIIDGTKYCLGLNENSIWYRTVGAIVIYLICLGIVFLIKKVPFLRKLVP